MIQDTAVRLLLLVFALVVLYATPAASNCAAMEDQHLSKYRYHVCVELIK